jgi:hypothetical protein
MEPPLALHESGVFGFGLEKAVLDLSADRTPPEIMELFGTGQDFKGLWLPHVRIFVAPKGATGLSFDVRANDLLLDFRQGVSGEFVAEIINTIDGKVVVQPRFYEGERQILPVRGYNLPGDPRSTTIRGSRASVPADGELQVAITGGNAPYKVTVSRDGQEIQATAFVPPGGALQLRIASRGCSMARRRAPRTSRSTLSTARRQARCRCSTKRSKSRFARRATALARRRFCPRRHSASCPAARRVIGSA